MEIVEMKNLPSPKKIRRIIIVISLIFIFNFVIVTSSSTNLRNNEQFLSISRKKFVLDDPVRISELGFGSSDEPEMVIDSQGNIHVVWVENTAERDGIYYRKYNFAFSNWTDIQEISNQIVFGYSNFPDVDIDDFDNVHIIWQEEIVNEYKLQYRKLNNQEWSQIQTIVNRSISSNSHAISIINSNKAFIIWADEINETRELLYKYQQNEITWKNDSVIITNFTRPYHPGIVNYNQNEIHLVWSGYNKTSDRRDIIYQMFDGSLWKTGSELVISKIDSLNANKPDLVIDSNGKISLVWENDFIESNSRIQFRSLCNQELENIVNITNSGSAHEPKVCTDNNDTIHLLWEQSLKLYYKAIFNFGWIKTVEIFEKESIILDPLIGCYNNQIQVIWNDYSIDKSWEIYYMSGVISEKNNLPILIGTILPLSTLIIIIIIIISRRKKLPSKV